MKMLHLFRCFLVGYPFYFLSSLDLLAVREVTVELVYLFRFPEYLAAVR